MDVTSALKSYRAGETVHFGDAVWLDAEGLHSADQCVKLNTIAPLQYEEARGVVITRLGERVPWLILPGADLDVLLLLDVVNQLISEIPYIKRRAVTGWPPGSVGDLSVRLNYDWRELKMAGYSDKEIYRVLAGEWTLDELLQRRPGQK